MTQPIIVLKFGSSVLRDAGDLPRAVHEIYRHWREGWKVLAVVSAFEGETDRLLALAGAWADGGDAARAALAATGETASAALLTLALERAGLRARLLDPAQAGLRTAGGTLDARPVALDAAALHAALEDGIAVLPGFCGRDERGATTLLGRGGSDASALFVAAELGAECRLVKDVDGLHLGDPAVNPAAPRFAGATFTSALAHGGPLIQPAALRAARERGQQFTLGSPGGGAGSRIGAPADRLVPAAPPPAPLRVALLGCGTVGLGVYRHLAAQPGRYEVIGVAVRDAAKAAAAGVPERLLTRGAAALAAGEAEIVVELIGGVEPARALVAAALGRGAAVVTANKALLAAHGPELAALAARTGASLRHCAAAGGALPVLEAAARLGRQPGLTRLSAVLNGTCNFILERMAAGDSPDAALAAARAAGYAEADPALDLDGTDSAQKLALLAQAAFGKRPPVERLADGGLRGVDPEWPARAARSGGAVRLVGEIKRREGFLVVSHTVKEVPAGHPFATLRGAENGLLAEFSDGPGEFLAARGAGRWATAEAVFADLEDERRARTHESAAWPEEAAS